MGSLKQRLKQLAPDWALDLVFAIGRAAKPGLAKRSALKMCHRLQAQPDVQVPPGYGLKLITGPTPPPGWQETLRSAGIQVSDETWAEDFARQPSARVVAITSGDQIVGTAGVTPLPRWPAGMTLVTWVGIRTEHQGKGLGGPLVAACLREASKAGMTTVFLLTDDHRLPAIRTYLRAGFRPCLTTWDWTHRPRWRRILRALKMETSTCEDASHAWP